MGNMRKVLIVGAAGMLGASLMKIYRKYEVRGISRDILDITDKEKAVDYVTRYRPHLVINAAAYNAVDACENNEEEKRKAFAVNGQGIENLARAAAHTQCTFVTISSDYIFDGVAGYYNEMAKANPLSVYGKSKYAGEKAVQSVAKQHPKWKWYIIRTSKLFGQRGSSPTAKKSFFEKMQEHAEQHNTLRVIDSEKSCFTYVPDLAQALFDLVRDNVSPGIYHLVNEEPATWYEGVAAFMASTKQQNILVPVSPDVFPRPAKRPETSVLLNTKRPQLRPYTEALKDYLATL